MRLGLGGGARTGGRCQHELWAGSSLLVLLSGEPVLHVETTHGRELSLSELRE